jgi:pimeloyl-ACP methyl ester carboxylesterase
MKLSVRSADGTAISARHRGRGSPIVLVHGIAGTINTFALAEHALASKHAVWVYDRRGRGGSGDTWPYTLDREADDVLAILDAAGPDAHLVGHSFGAVCALLAAGRRPGLRTLTLYEPPLWLDRADPRILSTAAMHLEAADFDLGLPLFFSLAGITLQEAAAMRGIPDIWADMCHGAGRAPRELLALTRAPWRQAPLEIEAPTLLLSGSQTRADIYPSPHELRQVIPHAQSAALARQGHLGFAFDPAGFAQALLSFLAANETPATTASTVSAVQQPAPDHTRTRPGRPGRAGSPAGTDSPADAPAASSGNLCDA